MAEQSTAVATARARARSRAPAQPMASAAANEGGRTRAAQAAAARARELRRPTPARLISCRACCAHQHVGRAAIPEGGDIHVTICLGTFDQVIREKPASRAPKRRQMILSCLVGTPVHTSGTFTFQVSISKYDITNFHFCHCLCYCYPNKCLPLYRPAASFTY
jgi:hypothetical protein